MKERMNEREKRKRDGYHNTSVLTPGTNTSPANETLSFASSQLRKAKRGVMDIFQSPKLVLISHKPSGAPEESIAPQEIYLNRPLLRFGSSDNNDVVIKGGMIKKVHCLVYNSKNSDGTVNLHVRDNRSKYGTWTLNRTGLKACPGLKDNLDHTSHVKHGDRIMLGKEFGEAEGYEVVYEVKMPRGSRYAHGNKYKKGKGGGVVVKSNIEMEQEKLEQWRVMKRQRNVNEIPKLVEEQSFWWDEVGIAGENGRDEGSVGSRSVGTRSVSTRSSRVGRKIQSRVARLRKAAGGGGVKLPMLFDKRGDDGGSTAGGGSSIVGNSVTVSEGEASSYASHGWEDDATLESIGDISSVNTEDLYGGSSMAGSMVGSIGGSLGGEHHELWNQHD